MSPGAPSPVRLAAAPALALLLGLAFAAAGCAQLLGADGYHVASSADAGAEAPDAADPMQARCATSTGGVPDGGIVLGALLPYTTSAGAIDTRGKLREQAIALAVADMNQRGGVGGLRPFEVVFCDTSGDPAIARQAAEHLVSTRGVPALITQGSGETISVAAATIPAGVLVMSATATSPELTTMTKKRSPSDPAGLVWRTAPSDAVQGRVLAQLVTAAAQAASKVAVLAVDDPYGQGLAGQFTTDYTASDTQSFYFLKDADPSSVLAQVDTYAPNFVLLIGYPNDVAAVLAAAPAGLKTARWYFADSAKSGDVFSKLADKSFVEGSLGTAPASAAGKAFTQFVDRYSSRYGTDPTTASFTAHNYDAAYLLGLAASWAVSGGGAVTGLRMAQGLTFVSSGTDKWLQPTDYAAMRDSLEAGTGVNVEGASGPLDFDPATGEAPSPIEVWQYTAAAGVKTLKTCQPTEVCTP